MEQKFTYAKKTEVATNKVQAFDYFVVLDFEAVWNITEDKKTPVEIIGLISIILISQEFPSLIVDAKSLENISEFDSFVKPEINRLNSICIETTGIQQEWVDKAPILKDVLVSYNEWMISNKMIDEKGNPIKKFLYVTCGDWDLGRQLPEECSRSNISKPRYFDSFANIKHLFCNFYKTKEKGMAGMLEQLKIELTGRHHSGIDDCRNIAKILKQLIKEGCIIQPTESRYSIFFPGV